MHLPLSANLGQSALLLAIHDSLHLCVWPPLKCDMSAEAVGIENLSIQCCKSDRQSIDLSGGDAVCIVCRLCEW